MCEKIQYPEASQWRRVIWLHREVQAERYPSARDLMAAFEVSRRTAMADAAFLRDSLDAPLEYCRGRNGYRYTAPFSLPEVPLGEGELLAMFLAEQAASQLAGTPFGELLRSAVQKLASQFPDTVRFSLEEFTGGIRFSGAGGPGIPPRLFGELRQAIRSRNRVRILYYTQGRGELNEREVDPHILDNVRGDWMLIAWDHLRDAERVFHLARIRDWRVLEETFSPRAELDPAVYDRHRFLTEHGSAPFEAVLRFDEWQARWIRERVWHPSQTLEELPDGGLILRLTVSGQGDLLRWVLGYGGHAEVLAPPKLRARAAEELRKAAELYG